MKHWTLSHGCHNGSITSRDSSTQECESLQDCKDKLKQHLEFYLSIGYVIWFADAISPEGEKIQLCESNSDYDGPPFNRRSPYRFI